MTALLEIRGVRAGYDTGDVLQGVDLDLHQGEVVALLGRNGVGKTTLMNTLVGLLRPRAGSVSLDGRELAGASPHEIARAGIAIVPQGRRIFARLTVEENLKLAAGRPSGDRTSNGRSTTSTACSRASVSDGGTTATSSRAASSRWSRSAVRSSPIPACSSSTSRPRGSRPIVVDLITEHDRRPAGARAVGDRRRAEPACRRRARRPRRDHDEGRARLSGDDDGIPRRPRHGTRAPGCLVRAPWPGANRPRTFATRSHTPGARPSRTGRG